MVLDWAFHKFIFRPEKLKGNYIFNFSHEFSELKFFPQADIMLSGLHFKVKNSKGILIYFHGNKGNLVRWGLISSALLRFDYDIIVMDYRGYGKSTGKVSEENLYSDALFCYNQIMTTLNPPEVIIYGRSLGTGIASYLAGLINPKMLVLETPFFNISEVIGQYIPPFLNTFKMKFNSYEHLKNSNFPILIIHGTKDKVVPFTSGKKLAQSLKNPSIKFEAILAGKHNNLSNFDQYWKSLNQFIEANER